MEDAAGEILLESFTKDKKTPVAEKYGWIKMFKIALKIVGNAISKTQKKFKNFPGTMPLDIHEGFCYILSYYVSW